MKLKRTLTASALLLCLIVLALTFLPQFVLGFLGMPRRYHAATANFAAAQAPAPVKTHHVVFAVTSGDEADWKLTMANLRNLVLAFGTDPYEIELVAFGPGISMLAAPSAVGDDIKAMQEKQVHFKACQNAMRARKLTVTDLVPNSEPVPAGIVELVTKEEQGWIYVKGGR